MFACDRIDDDDGRCMDYHQQGDKEAQKEDKTDLPLWSVSLVM